MEEAEGILRRRLERREDDFLALVRATVFQHPQSPYRQLLHLAGCEYGDLERLVNQDGVEGALRTLFRHGVYLTVDEFKGRRPVVRGTGRVAVDQPELRNPLSTVSLIVGSSGSRGASTLVPADLAFIRDRSINFGLALRARGAMGWSHAIWGVPGSSSVLPLLEFCGSGAPPVRWWSQVPLRSVNLAPRYRWSVWVLRWGGVLARAQVPRPDYVSLENPRPIIEWMRGALRSGRTPHLYTFGSSAVRLCKAALDDGLDLKGAEFTVGGEPITDLALGWIGRAGAVAVPRYAVTEPGRIGGGCLAPQAPDDVHHFHDLHAIIQPGPGGPAPGPPAQALLISSIRPTAPLVLLNVSLGDQAVMTRRACGCPMDRLGWTTHLHAIRSFEKLTAGGMSFLDTDVIRVLEEILPARFGGGPTDYQLVEEEAEDVRPCLRLLVHPAVGSLNPNEVAEAFLSAISRGSGAEQVMGMVWCDGNFLRVERRAPLPTASGKILHLHVEHRPETRPESPTPAKGDRGPGFSDPA